MTIDALKQLRKPEDIAEKRGKKLILLKVEDMILLKILLKLKSGKRRQELCYKNYLLKSFMKTINKLNHRE